MLKNHHNLKLIKIILEEIDEEGISHAFKLYLKKSFGLNFK